MSDAPAQRPIGRLAIVNRGEPAMRAIQAVRELNAERDRPIRLIALFTAPDRDALFVRRADESSCLGPARAYLDLGALERALVETRADAAWVGWGFVAECPEFAELCERLGITFVGPDAAAMRLLGNKVNAKLLAQAAGIPVAPWSGGVVGTLDEARRHAAAIGFPLMVKAVAGGGGRGIREVRAAGALAAAFRSARSEAVEAFGDGGVLLERMIVSAVHAEVQVIADGYGNAWAVGVRDCSCQRRHQKVIEESSSPALDAGQQSMLRASAARLVQRAGYRGAATVEFLYEPLERTFSFMEVNARLQVEHPVTEVVTGLDLVKLQLHVAEGGRLTGEPPAPRGHAVELRICAEDPARGFAPAPGRIELLRLPCGPGIRIDSGVVEGDEVPAEFDSMIAKLIVSGATRDEALARARRALADTSILIEGGATNQGFLLALLDQRELREGTVDTGWLDRSDLDHMTSHRHADIALVAAAIEIATDELARDRSRFLALARGGAPHAGVPLRRKIDLRHRAHSYRVHVAQTAAHRFGLTLDAATVEASYATDGLHERRLTVAGDRYRICTSVNAADLLVSVDGVAHRISRDDGDVVRAPGPCVVAALPVVAGDEVAEGDVVAVVESMKMELSLTAPFASRVREVTASLHAQVAGGAPLLSLARDDEAKVVESSARVAFAWPAAAPWPVLDAARRLTLGYDVDPVQAASDVRTTPGNVDPGEIHAAEDDVLGVYADLRALTRAHRDLDDAADVPASPRAELHLFLRSLDAERERLPAGFTAALLRALSHYGVGSLDRGPALEAACHRLYVAHERAGGARDIVIAILDARLEREPPTPVSAARDVLDRVVAATAGDDRVVADLAREVRHRWFDAPIIEDARARVYDTMRERLDALQAAPRGPGRVALIEELVRCPRPLAPLLTSRMSAADQPARIALLEVMTRRYYRLDDRSALEALALGSTPALQARLTDGEVPLRLTSAFIELDRLADAARALAVTAAGADPGERVQADLYARRPPGGPAGDELAETLGNALADVEMPAVDRIVIAIADPEAGHGMSAVEIFTFQRGDGSRLREDRVTRGIHPMMARRLELSRYSAFELERVPSVDDVYVFRGRAREHPADERLFALAEVRDLTPVRDDDGQVTALPELELKLVEQLEALRALQAHRPASGRLQWNRLTLHVWPIIDLTAEELRRVVARHGRAIAGLGVELIALRGRMRDSDTVRDRIVRLTLPAGGDDVVVEIGDPPTRPLRAADERARRVIAARRRGTVHPLEIIQLLAPARSDTLSPNGAAGDFCEHDLDPETGRLAPVDRPPATNAAGVITGLVRNYTDRYPEGMARVAIFSDPTRALGAVAEAECRRIIAALDLAQELGVPLEWFAVSAGARIAMDSGTENMDWVASVLRRIIEFTQGGGECNVVVTGINVGAQPYWNAEATMLMHTKGILVMTPASAMVLTGKASLDYSGGVSADDNFGIGGYDGVMGPNGQAQYWAPDLPAACALLLRHYDHAYVAPGERFPRRAATTDPPDRDVRAAEHRAAGCDVRTVGEIFSDATNAARKKPFDIRTVMGAVADRDHAPLERWAEMHDADSAVVWDAHLGGWPVAMVGFESRPLERASDAPADGPREWTAGTLFPMSSKKVARAVNAASGVRPLVVLANLAGFDGSPESMRRRQLEFGAEIGRAVVNFDGPIVFCVVSRYHGGAFVVFSQRLNDDLETLALEGARASVIGGAPAAAVVLAREVDAAARADPRIAKLDNALLSAQGTARRALLAEREEQWTRVRAEELGHVAAEFDHVHSVERAVAMGSVSGVIPAASLRPMLIEAVERGMRRYLSGIGSRRRHPAGGAYGSVC